MITPLQIQEKEFSRGVRGYKEDEVDDFLDELIVQMETLLKENVALKQQAEELEAELAQIRNSETSVVGTLEAAKALMQDISISAEKRAQIIVKNAELDAKRIRREAEDETMRLTEESAELRRNFSTFKEKYRSFLESELQRFDTLTNDIFPDFTMNDLKQLEEEQLAPKKKKLSDMKEELKPKASSRETVVFTDKF